MYIWIVAKTFELLPTFGVALIVLEKHFVLAIFRSIVAIPIVTNANIFWILPKNVITDTTMKSRTRQFAVAVLWFVLYTNSKFDQLALQERMAALESYVKTKIK